MNYQKIYNDLIIKAKSRCEVKCGECHHILPKSMNGTDDKSNLVKLTHREHFIAHLLLYKIHKNRQMAYALSRMMNSKHKNRCSSRTYEIARKIHSEEVSKWAKKFMSDKVLMRHKETNECCVLEVGKYDKSKYVGVNFGKKLNNTKSIGKTIYKDEFGTTYHLSVDDPKIKKLNLVGVGSTKKATECAAKIQKSRVWYEKKPISEQVVLSIPSLYEWFKNEYDSSKPKATGLRKWLNVYNISKSKIHVRAFNEMKNGWKPNTHFYEVYNEIIKNQSI